MSLAAVPRLICTPSSPISFPTPSAAGSASFPIDQSHAPIMNRRRYGAARNGATKLIMINGHGGNGPALHLAAQMINKDAHIFTTVESGETSDPDIYELAETPNDVHAGEMETSTTLAVRPELVDFARSRKFVPRFSSRYLNFSTKRSVEWYTRTEKISSSGVLGDPTKASRAKGEQIWEMMILRLVEFVEDLKGMTLEEIYQKRY